MQRLLTALGRGFKQHVGWKRLGVVASLIVIAMCMALGFMAMRAAGAAAQVMTQMFSSPADLGWPSGVQEDDDFHWSWSRLSARALQRPPASPSDDSRARPEIVELLDGTGPRPSPVARHREVRLSAR